MDAILHHYFNTNIAMPVTVLTGYRAPEDPTFLNARGSRRFNRPLANFDQQPLLHNLHVMHDRVSNEIERLQNILPLWAIGPEAERDDEDEITRKPDFIVYKYDDNLAGTFAMNNLTNYGFFEHTVVEIKRGRNSGYTLERILEQLHGQCTRLENPTRSCFAIAMKGFRVWFFEFFGELNTGGVPIADSYRELGFHFIRPHPDVLYYYQSLRESLFSRMRDGEGMGDPLSGWVIGRDDMIIHHLLRYMSSYNQPLGYMRRRHVIMSFVEVPFPF